MTTAPLLAHDPVLAGLLEAASGPSGPLGPDLHLMTLLRHLPGRRAALLADRLGTPVVVKVFASPRARGNHRRLVALARSGLAPITPEAVAVGADGHVGVVSFTPGQVLDSVSDAEFVEGSSGAGLALARLHRSAAVLDRSWTWQDEIDQLVRRAPISLLAVARCARRRPLPEAPLVPSHRDFHPRQVILATTGTVRLIDFDDTAMAPAGLDVGNMVAHLHREATVHGRPGPVVEAAVRAFLVAYGTPPTDLQQWVQLSLIRLACLAETRHLDRDQRDALLKLARPTFAAAPPSRATLPSGLPSDLPSGLPSGHADRPVRFEERPDGSRVVIKRFHNGDGAEVHDGMRRLWESSFGARRRPRPGMPAPLGWSSGRHELAMELMPGEPVAHRGSLGSSLEVAEEAGRLLADLHASSVGVQRRRPLHRLLRSAARKVAERRDEPGAAEFASTLEVLELALGQQPDEGPLVLSHGDFSPRNLMQTGTGLVLIDFDRVQMAAPARDLAYWGAWLWTTHVLGGGSPEDSWQLAEPFNAAYLRHATAGTAPAPSVLALHRALALVRIAHGWSALRGDAAAVSRILVEARRQLVPTLPEVGRALHH